MPILFPSPELTTIFSFSTFLQKYFALISSYWLFSVSVGNVSGHVPSNEAWKWPRARQRKLAVYSAAYVRFVLRKSRIIWKWVKTGLGLKWNLGGIVVTVLRIIRFANPGSFSPAFDFPTKLLSKMETGSSFL